jgi:hypothetical protein
MTTRYDERLVRSSYTHVRAACLSRLVAKLKTHETRGTGDPTDRKRRSGEMIEMTPDVDEGYGDGDGVDVSDGATSTSFSAARRRDSRRRAVERELLPLPRARRASCHAFAAHPALVVCVC